MSANRCALCRAERDPDQLVPLGGSTICADAFACSDEQDRQRQQDWAEQQRQHVVEQVQAQASGVCVFCARERRGGLVPIGDSGAVRCSDAAGCSAERDRAARQAREREQERKTVELMRMRAQRGPAEPVRLRRGGGWLG